MKVFFQMFYKISLINFITYFYYLVNESSRLLSKETGSDEQGKQNNVVFYTVSGKDMYQTNNDSIKVKNLYYIID